MNFTIEGSEPMRFAASPHIVFKLRITNDGPETIHSVILKTQVHIDAPLRRYSADEQLRLADLYGEPSRWGQTLRGLLWTNTTQVISSFKTSTLLDLQIPCTFDFNVAATKYFAGLDDGEVPVTCFFNGTIFHAAENGAVQVEQISWEKEAPYRMPIRIWREMMDVYYPNTAWLCLQRDAFDRLNAFKVQHGIPTFDEALLSAMVRV